MSSVGTVGQFDPLKEAIRKAAEAAARAEITTETADRMALGTKGLAALLPSPATRFLVPGGAKPLDDRFASYLPDDRYDSSGSYESYPGIYESYPGIHQMFPPGYRPDPGDYGFPFYPGDYGDLEPVPLSDTGEYLMSFDGDGDGYLSKEEFAQATQSISNSGYDGQPMSEADIATFVDSYGVNMLDENGNMVRALDKYGVEAMVGEGSLIYGEDAATGEKSLYIAVDRISDERIIKGASSDFENLTQEELGVAFERLGIDTNDPTQMEFLTKVYGDGSRVTVDAVTTTMQEDGFQTLDPGAAPTLTWDNIDSERVATALFKEVGVDPNAKGASLNAQQYYDAVTMLFGSNEGLSLGDAQHQVDALGTDGRLTVEELAVVFDEKMISLSAAEGSSTVTLDANTEGMAHHEFTGWWDSAMSYLGEEVHKVVEDASKLLGIGKDIVAGLLNGTIKLDELGEKAAADILKRLGEAIADGNDSALDFVQNLGKAILTGGTSLIPEGQKLVNQLVEDAKAGGNDLAVGMLMDLAGLTAEQAQTLINDAVEPMALYNQLSGMTFEEMKAFIPDFEEKYAEGEAMVKEFWDTVAKDEEALAQLEKEGWVLDENGHLVSSETGGRMLEEDKQDYADKHLRFDIAIELNSGLVKGTALDALQGRVFFTMPRRDADGNQYMEFRVRELDEAGLYKEFSNGNVDGGLVAVRDLVVPFYVSGEKAGQRGDILYNSTLGVIVEGDTKITDLSSVFGNQAWVTGLPNGYDKASALEQTWGEWAKNKIDFEFGAGIGFTTTYNFDELARNGEGDRIISPFLGEIFGGLIGLGVGAAAMTGAEVFSEGGATAFLSKYGITSEHAMGMIGAFGFDAVMATRKEDDGISLSVSDFEWLALRTGTKNADFPDLTVPISGSGWGAWAQVRGRIQANHSIWSDTLRT